LFTALELTLQPHLWAKVRCLVVFLLTHCSQTIHVVHILSLKFSFSASQRDYLTVITSEHKQQCTRAWQCH